MEGSVSGSNSLYGMVLCNAGDKISVNAGSNTNLYVEHTTSLTVFAVPINSKDPIPNVDVAFYAKLKEDKGFATGATIPFNDEIINIGGWYYPNQGLFVCPDDAYYVFMWTYRTIDSGQTAMGNVL